jgi:hypothetical protein
MACLRKTLPHVLCIYQRRKTSKCYKPKASTTPLIAAACIRSCRIWCTHGFVSGLAVIRESDLMCALSGADSDWHGATEYRHRWAMLIARKPRHQYGSGSRTRTAARDNDAGTQQCRCTMSSGKGRWHIWCLAQGGNLRPPHNSSACSLIDSDIRTVAAMTTRGRPNASPPKGKRHWHWRLVPSEEEEQGLQARDQDGSMPSQASGLSGRRRRP